MELNTMPGHHDEASVSLKVVLLVFVIVLIGALGYLVWMQNSTSDNSGGETTVKVTPKTTTTSTSPDPTVSWNKGSLSSEKLNFRYAYLA